MGTPIATFLLGPPGAPEQWWQLSSAKEIPGSLPRNPGAGHLMMVEQSTLFKQKGDQTNETDRMMSNVFSYAKCQGYMNQWMIPRLQMLESVRTCCIHRNQSVIYDWHCLSL